MDRVAPRPATHSGRAGRRAARAAAALVAVLAAALVLQPALASGRGGQHTASSPQRLAVPAYFPPGSNWSRLEGGAPQLGLAVMNPDNGPGVMANGAYAHQVWQSHSAGIRVLGYLHSSEGTRPALVVDHEIDEYRSWYGVDGVLVDEASTDCALRSYYTSLAAHAHRVGAAQVALGFGTDPPSCFADAAEILVTFAGPYSAYLTRPPSPSWVARYPAARFWHIVDGAATTAQLDHALALSRTRHAGWVYVTSQTEPHPYAIMPPSSYWKAEVASERSAAHG